MISLYNPSQKSQVLESYITLLQENLYRNYLLMHRYRHNNWIFPIWLLNLIPDLLTARFISTETPIDYRIKLTIVHI